jgi:polysaccharide export outer membrane protein
VRRTVATAFVLPAWALLLGAALPLSLHGQSPAPAPPSGTYVIRHGDMLAVRIWPDAQLGGEFPVEESGIAHLPMIGEVRAAGMTLDQLRTELRERYGQALKSPVVSVTPMFRVSLLGAVGSAGLYRIDPTQTLLDVVSMAGGFAPNAKPDRVRIVREGQVIEVNAKRSLDTGAGLTAFTLQSGDRIVVPTRTRIVTFQNVFYVLQTALMVATLNELRKR